MRETISFIILNNTGSIKQVTVSRSFFRSMSLCFMTCLIVLAFAVSDYYHFKKNFITNQKYNKKNAEQLGEIINQRRQIQFFADEINTLKSKLSALNDFENTIRIIANIDTPAGQEELFGVGGSVPEDLDTQIPLTSKHTSLLREMHIQTPQLELVSTNQVKRFDFLLKYLVEKRDLFYSTPTICPAKGWITSQFGYRLSPYTGVREFHKGLDIANLEGAPVVAPADGIVAFTGANIFRGNFIVIDHNHGIVTRYAHIQKALKKNGETVKRGETIALLGNTGRSTGPHLHYEVYLKGIPVNPTKYILN